MDAGHPGPMKPREEGDKRTSWWSSCQCREHGPQPWSGKIPHAVGQLAHGPQLLRPRAWKP